MAKKTMGQTGKILMLGGLALLLVKGVSYGLGLGRVKKEVEIEQEVEIYSFDLMQLVLRINVKLKNPTAVKFSIEHPFVKIQYQGNTLASSQIRKDIYPVEARSEVSMKPIDITISTLKLGLTAPALIKELRAKGSTVITAITTTKIDGSIENSDTKQITIGTAKQEKEA